MAAKREFLAYCETHGLRVEHESRRGLHHVHVWAPSGLIFSGLPFLDNLGVWDGGPPNWTDCLEQVVGAMPLEPDPELTR